MIDTRRAEFVEALNKAMGEAWRRGATDCDPRHESLASAHVLALYDDAATAGQGEVERDAERLDFLESLMKRKRKFGWQDKEWPLDTDLHISAMGAALYARSGIGSDCDFSARGKTVRETIDAARTQEKSK